MIRKTVPESDGMLLDVVSPTVEGVVLTGGDDYHAPVVQPLIVAKEFRGWNMSENL